MNLHTPPYRVIYDFLLDEAGQAQAREYTQVLLDRLRVAGISLYPEHLLPGDLRNNDWTNEGIEDDTDMWWLDLHTDIRVKLFIPVKATPPYCDGTCRLFIEQDQRWAGRRDLRVHYTYFSWSIGFDEALALLHMRKDELDTFLIDRIAVVRALPNDRALCGDLKRG